jgi:hypothetical protein
MRHIPDAVIFFTGFIMAIFFLFCGIYWTKNKTIGQLTLFSGIVFGLFTSFLYWQNDNWKDRFSEVKPDKPYTHTKEQKLPDRKIKHALPPFSRPTVSNKEPVAAPQSQQTASIIEQKGNILNGPNYGTYSPTYNENIGETYPMEKWSADGSKRFGITQHMLLPLLV